MAYLGELRRNMRPLLAASLGTGLGLMLISYISTIFGPYLIKAFGWSRTQFALVGLTALATMLVLPLIGRLADRIGVKRAAIVGVLGMPACFFGYSLMNGNFAVYLALSTSVQIFGIFTTPLVYARLIAADFERARGLALTIVTVTPAALGAIAAPALTAVIDQWGWRIGYRGLAAVMLAGGLIAVALVPAHAAATTARADPARTAARLPAGAILRSGPFRIIFAAMFLCTLATALHASQMGLMLQDHHLDSIRVAAMISLYGVGTILGRIACGIALDRFATPVVAAVSMALPAIGYALLASGTDHVAMIGIAMALVGLAVGAEGDLQSYLVARHFAVRVFSTTLSLILAGVFAAAVIGSLLISLSLKVTGSMNAFLAAVAVATAVGAGLFLLLPRAAPAWKLGEETAPPTHLGV